MKKRTRVMSSLAVAAALCMGSFFAAASDLPAASGEPADDGLADAYATFAGSPGNARALVEGLIHGTRITLVMPDAAHRPVPSTFMPKTGKLSYDNARMALALAQAALAKSGIARPTAAQIEAALNGGAIMAAYGPAQMPGVLALRSRGQVWGNISKALGVPLAADGSVAAGHP